MGGPIPPAEYDGEHLDTDEKLEEAGWATGLDVWSVLDKVLGETLGDGVVANAMLWSLREAVRAEHLEELTGPANPRSERTVACGWCLSYVRVTDGVLSPHPGSQTVECRGSRTRKCGDPNNCTCTHGCDIP